MGEEQTEGPRKIICNISNLTEGNKNKLSNLFEKVELLKKEEPPEIEIQEQVNLKIVINHKPDSKRKVVKEDFEKKRAEEKIFVKLYNSFCKLHKKYHKSFPDIIKSFMKVSGDLKKLNDLFMGNKVVEWTYLEDMALKKPTNSTEYGCLIQSKGEKEIEKRKEFLKDFEGNQEFLNLMNV
ncbi:unnamed protein product [Moneuplotes crassus]|uniref:Uncharacterized protein n=1 Tax=Euplotes crassus TaxID=5936 RepID=A0AAD2D5F8_EUPCR|nr:unnamed protein product [Moneuplotes crassus]